MNMSNLLLTPPITFVIFLALGLLISYLGSLVQAKGKESAGKLTSYACGQSDVPNHISPDYSQFFPYAFFFTIMHVLALVVATAPYEAMLMPVIYIAAGILAMVIIFKD